jgi:hypothetical protein
LKSILLLQDGLHGVLVPLLSNAVLKWEDFETCRNMFEFAGLTPDRTATTMTQTACDSKERRGLAQRRRRTFVIC